ncbi:general substrate transporter [Dactylonectria estremocensis]|uniref:General substrate transporter n=1 Tax=Dactylonectria estremocensis TaxID=1079267 RepID=A0A9P9FAY5_9HYPO|nr:general substrate transporter [Dactylonectria estremocensis]
MMLICLVAALNCASVGYDASMMSSLNILTSFQDQFGIDTNLKGLLTAAQNLGGIVAGMFAGAIVDKLGRKGGILVSSCIVLLSCILHSTATHKAQLFVGRILVGFAKSVDIAAVPTYLVELAPPSRRGFVAGLYWACWLLGAIISAAVGYGARSMSGDWAWRLLCVCMAAPAALCIVSLPFIPESPRWLISRGREREGLDVLSQFHGGGDQTHPMVVTQFREIREAIAYEQANGFDSYRAWWKAFVSVKSNLYRAFILLTLGVFEQTIGSSIITFYLSSVLDLAGITSEKDQFAINFSQSSVAFASALVGICIIDKVGRVPMLVGGTAFCAAVLATMAGLTADQTDNAIGRNAIIAMVFLFQIGYSSTWTPLSFSYCAEILNFTIRAKGMGLYSTFTSTAGFFNQYVIPIGLKGIGWRFYLVGVCWNIFVALVIFFTYMETSGLTLEQIDQRFNGVPRDELVDIVDAFDGGKPISEGELNGIDGKEVEVVQSAVASKFVKGRGA